MKKLKGVMGLLAMLAICIGITGCDIDNNASVQKRLVIAKTVIVNSTNVLTPLAVGIIDQKVTTGSLTAEKATEYKKIIEAAQTAANALDTSVGSNNQSRLELISKGLDVAKPMIEELIANGVKEEKITDQQATIYRTLGAAVISGIQNFISLQSLPDTTAAATTTTDAAVTAK